jgi:hypothetical protein
MMVVSVMHLTRLFLCVGFGLAIQFAPGHAAANASRADTYYAKAAKKPAPKPKKTTRSTVQENLECPPPARPACGR